MQPLQLIRTLALFLALSTSAGLFSSEATGLYVAKGGDDRWPGTVEKPLASIRGARDAIRRLPEAQRKPGVNVTIGGGVYELDETLTFEVQDSGRPGAPIRYAAAPGADVVISGGRRITTDWKTDDGRIFYTDIPEARNGRWPFKQLFVNGHRAVRARFPNGSQTLTVVADSEDKLTINVPVGTAKKSWAKSKGALLNIVAEKHWFNEIVEIAGVSDDGSAISIRGREATGRILKGNFFFVEGLREELDSPGEWHLDLESGRLYYWPEQGNPNESAIVAPVLTKAIEFAGSRNSSDRVSYITLSGFTFTDLDYTVGHLATRTSENAAIRLTNARNCVVEESKFTNVGGYAIWLHLDSCENRIINNEMGYLGAGGILATSARFAYATHEEIYEEDPLVKDLAPLRNEISGNHVHHGGLIRRYCSGVHLDSRPLSTALRAGNRVSFNHIHDMPRNGIFAFVNQGGNLIENNLIHDVIQVVDDGGAVHLATTNPLAAPNVVRGNFFRGIGRRPDMLANGVFLDWFTSHVLIENNVITDSVHGSVKILGSDDVTVTNNILANDPVSLIVSGHWCSPEQTGVRFNRNILLNRYPNAEFIRFFTEEYSKPKDDESNLSKFGESDDNIFWNAGLSVFNLVSTKSRPLGADPNTDLKLSFASWQAHGLDGDSIIADPQLSNLSEGNRLEYAADAGKNRFKSFKISAGGRFASDSRPANFDLLEGEGTFVSDEDVGALTLTGTWISKRAILPNQQHTFFTELVSESAATRAGLRVKAVLPTAGRYEVWLRWFDVGQPLSTSIDLTVTSSSMKVVKKIDQSSSAQKWRLVGLYECPAGEAYIDLASEESSAPMAFKAVAFVRKP